MIFSGYSRFENSQKIGGISMDKDVRATPLKWSKISTFYKDITATLLFLALFKGVALASL
jgi:hypothetical protein